MTDPVTPSTQAQTPAAPLSAENQHLVDLASLQRAVVSLGSALIAGGPPGAAGYLAWHKDQIARNPPKAEPVNAPPWAKLRTDGPTLEQFVAAGYKKEDYPPAGYAAKPVAPGTPPIPGQPPVQPAPVTGSPAASAVKPVQPVPGPAPAGWPTGGPAAK